MKGGGVGIWLTTTCSRPQAAVSLSGTMITGRPVELARDLAHLSPEGNGEGVQVDCGTREKRGDVFLVWLGGASWGLAGVGTCFAPLDLDHQLNKTGFQVIYLYGSVQLVGGGDHKSATVSLTES